MSHSTGGRTLLGQLLRDRRGAALLVFALAAPGVVGLAGLATEAGFWYLTRQRAQSAADYAALAGAIRLSSTQSSLQLTLAGAQVQARDAATDVTGQDGFTTGTANNVTTTVTVNVPPVAPSAYTTDATAVQVVIQRQMPRLVSALFLGADPVLTVSSTSRIVPGAPGTCILALTGQLQMQGTAAINASNCVAGSNAPGVGVSISNNNTLNAKLISTVGTCSGCGGGTPYKINQPPLKDPFASLQSLTYPSSCPSGSSPSPSGSSVANPTGTLYWCSDVSVSTSLDLAPGTYILYDANLKMTSNATITCSACTPGGAGVTFVLTGSSGSTVGSVSVTGQATITVNAPATGPYAGVVFYRDKLASNGDMKFAGGSGLDLIGGVYAPTSDVTWTGGSSSSSGSCHAIVAASLSFAGNATGSLSNCSQMGVNTQGNAVSIVE